jgi:hypothetical protein
MIELKTHPATNWLPQLPDAEYRELRDDIKKRGQREAILVKDGYIIDGRHRYRACQELDIEPRCEEYDGHGDIVAEIASRNLFRRNLLPQERADLVVKMCGAQLKAEAKARIKAHQFGATAALKSAQPQTRGRTAEKVAAIAKVGRDTARKALRAHRDGAAKKRTNPEKTLEQQVRQKLLRFVDYFPVTRHRAVKLEIIVALLCRYDGNKRIAPLSVTYPDGSTADITRILCPNQ